MPPLFLSVGSVAFTRFLCIRLLIKQKARVASEIVKTEGRITARQMTPVVEMLLEEVVLESWVRFGGVELMVVTQI